MQLHDLISSQKSAVWRQLIKFKSNINKNEIWRPKEDVQFVFLCGANINPGEPSRRRRTLMDFSSKNLPYAKFFLAESMFTVLKAEGHKANLLDIEKDLSSFADFVIIILESESAFCELGAFAAYKELRNKIIVINDSNHKSSPSFINLGPVKAIDEISGGNQVIHYKMGDNGKIYGDGIGDVFSKIYNLIHKEPKKRRSRVCNYNPNENFTKESLRFVHDLIYFSNPISLSEFSRILKTIFSHSNENNLQKHLALLCATGQVDRAESGLYSSTYNEPFFEYGQHDINDLIASFKNMYFRHDKRRLL